MGGTSCYRVRSVRDPAKHNGNINDDELDLYATATFPTYSYANTTGSITGPVSDATSNVDNPDPNASNAVTRSRSGSNPTGAISRACASVNLHTSYTSSRPLTSTDSRTLSRANTRASSAKSLSHAVPRAIRGIVKKEGVFF